MMRPLFAAALVLALGVPLAADDSPSPQPPAPSPSLHERIDRLVESAAVGPLAPLCSDADFVRRIHLDLTGVIPTAQQARDFIADKNTDKRQGLIDELLASPAFVRHMTITFDVMLMERKPEKVIKQPQWEEFLYQSLADDKPLDHLFKELVAADGAEAALRPAAKFTLDRDAEPNLLTRDIGRLVFGMDFQCCQCHDHPLIDDYYQDDYYGLFAFVHRTGLFTDAKSKEVSLSEKADGEASFKSVFTGASSDKALPRLPKGAVLFIEPTFSAGGGYVVAPAKDVRGVPKFSRRAALAEMIPGSREFSRNLANRLWAHMLGRGIVHPVDFHYAGNPPSNPPLLALLADELVSSQSRDGHRREAVVESRFTAGSFQLRPFLREIALTRTYQRSCDAPSPQTVNFADIAARLERLQGEKQKQQQSIQPLKDALAKTKAEFKAARDEDARVAAELPKLEAALADARQALEKATTARRAAEETAAKIREQARAIAQSAAKLAEIATTSSSDSSLGDAASKTNVLAAELNVASDAAAQKAAAMLAEHDTASKRAAAASEALAEKTAQRPGPNRLSELEHVHLAAEHQLADTQYGVAGIDAQMATANAVLDYASLAASDPAKAEVAWGGIVERWTVAGQVAPLKPLTPEQFAASAMQASELFSPHLASAEAKLDKSPPEALKNATEADKPRLRAKFQQLELLNLLRGYFGEFVRQYGGQPGQEFQATVGQALFLSNGDTVDGWLKQKGSLVARLVHLREQANLANSDAAGPADELYFSVLARPATEAEKSEVQRYLKDANDNSAAFKELVWALLSSTEFRFNH